MEELNRLPDEEQVSDDFELYKDDTNYYAIRERFGRNDQLSFCIEAKSKWRVVSDAVTIIEKEIVERGGSPRVPLELGLFYVPEAKGHA